MSHHDTHDLTGSTESDGVEEGIDIVGKRLAEAAELEAVRRQREALERERRRVVQETTLLSRERDELEVSALPFSC